MGLGLSSGASPEGGYGKIIKYDARAGRMFRVDREQNASGQYETENHEITQGFKAVFDMENVEVGYARFAAGSAPDFRMVALGEPMPPKPNDDYKQGFRVNLKLDKSVGGDVRELASCAKAVIGALDKLHNEYEVGVKTNAGKLPVVVMTGTQAAVSGQGAQKSTNYVPVFAIKSWVARPADLGAGGEAADEDDGFPVQSATPVTTKPKAGAKAVPPPAPVEDEDDFG